MPDPRPAGLLLFAHGARDPAWARPFHEVRRQVEALEPAARVELAFLEFMSPDLATAGASLASTGCTVVDVVPLFLGAGGHVRKDLPELMQALAQAHPQVQWRLQAAVGQDLGVMQAMAAAAVRRGVGAPGLGA